MQFTDFRLVRESEAQKKENQSTDKKKIKADLNDSLSLSSCEACDLACVAVADKALDPLIVEALDPAEIYAELFLVDGIIVIQRNGNCREDSFEILNFCHDFSPLLN